MHTRSGRLPLVLRIFPTEVGERALIWCRAGICKEDFELHAAEIAAACCARQARIEGHRRWAQIVIVDIVRRDTLAAHHVIASGLVGTAVLTESGNHPPRDPLLWARTGGWPQPSNPNQFTLFQKGSVGMPATLPLRSCSDCSAAISRRKAENPTGVATEQSESILVKEVVTATCAASNPCSRSAGCPGTVKEQFLLTTPAPGPTPASSRDWTGTRSEPMCTRWLGSTRTAPNTTSPSAGGKPSAGPTPAPCCRSTATPTR